MQIMRRFIMSFGFGLLALGLAGCSNSEPVRNLSVTTGDTATALAGSMGDIKQTALQQGKDRAASIARLRTTLQETEQDFERERKEVFALGGKQEQLIYTNLDKVFKIAEELNLNEFRFEAAWSETNTQLVGSLGPINNGGADLIKVAEGLYGLGKQRKTTDQIKFLFAFGKTLKKEIDTRRDALEAQQKPGSEIESSTVAALQ